MIIIYYILIIIINKNHIDPFSKHNTAFIGAYMGQKAEISSNIFERRTDDTDHARHITAPVFFSKVLTEIIGQLKKRR